MNQFGKNCNFSGLLFSRTIWMELIVDPKHHSKQQITIDSSSYGYFIRLLGRLRFSILNNLKYRI